MWHVAIFRDDLQPFDSLGVTHDVVEVNGSVLLHPVVICKLASSLSSVSADDQRTREAHSLVLLHWYLLEVLDERQLLMILLSSRC